jgi:hypothetical protein
LLGSIDVPEPLFAQQIWDSVTSVVNKGQNKLQKATSTGENNGWTETDLAKQIAATIEKIDKRSVRAVKDVIKGLTEVEDTYSIVQKQDVATAVSTGSSLSISITRLVISGGTDLISWTSLVRTLYKTAKYLDTALQDVSKLESKTLLSVRAVEDYYRKKVFKGKEGAWNKFRSKSSTLMKKAKSNTENLRNRIARAEKPCHDMAKIIQRILQNQDSGDSSTALESKLNILLISVSDTMEKVTPAKDSMRKTHSRLEKLEATLKKWKTGGKKEEQTMDGFIEKNKQEMVRHLDDLKKYGKKNSVAKWVSSAKNMSKLAIEFSKLA